VDNYFLQIHTIVLAGEAASRVRAFRAELVPLTPPANPPRPSSPASAPTALQDLSRPDVAARANSAMRHPGSTIDRPYLMAAHDEIFKVTDRWGDEIVLTRKDWSRITAKRPGVEGYLAHVRQTLERPNMVYEGRYEDSKVFYGKGLLD